MSYILRATAGNGSVRVFVADSRDIVQEAFKIHKTSPVMSAALGRTLTAASMMGLMLKGDSDILSINIRGDGPAKGLTVTADSKGNVKGYCFENMVDIPLKENGKLDVSGAIGNGELTVIKDMGLKEPYVGTIPLISGEIAEDITYYFAKSEQTPSAVALGVLVDRDYSIKAAGGFIIQMMPGAEDNVIDKTEEKLKTLPAVTKMYESGMTAEDILEKLFGDMELNRESIIKTEAAYKCNCTREKVEKALIAIGKKEIEKIIEEDGKAELHCHFCNKDYLFGENDLKEILLRI